MYVISSFRYSVHLELAVFELERIGIPKGSILAVPLEKQAPRRSLSDLIYFPDEAVLLDTGFMFAAVFTIVGASLGYRLPWGPVFCGLVSAASGFAIGFFVDWLVYVRKRKRGGRKDRRIDVFLLVHCTESESGQVESALWENRADGVARFQ